jgi:hypothetical protein
MMGEGVAARGFKTSIIGIVPRSVVPALGTDPDWSELEPNHSHFILVPAEKKGSATSTMFKLEQELCNPSTPDATNATKPVLLKTKSNKVPAIAVLAGGGNISRNEVLRTVRQNIPLIIIKGSGGFADEISEAAERKDALKEEPVMAEIITDGELHFHDLSQPVKGIERLIIRELGIDNVLMQAWETFAAYDYNANVQQKKFNTLQTGILVFGVLSTFLVILQQVFAPDDPKALSRLLSPADLLNQKPAGWLFWWVLHYLLILIPILLTVLVTAANRFKQGSKWLLLRAGAEAIKREIFRYRTRAMYYNQKPEQQLAQRIEDITRRTMRTEVNSSSLRHYNNDEKDRSLPVDLFFGDGDAKDDGFSFLVPDRYISIRLNDQEEFYRKGANKLEKQLNLLYWLTFIIGGLGSFLAAVGLEVWIAVTTSIVGAFVTYLGYKQTERTLMKYNQSATDLSNVRAWWNALSAEEQADQKNIDSLVEHTEQVLQSELDGWIQQMQNALAELRDSQKKYETPKGTQDGQGAQTATAAKQTEEESDNKDAKAAKKDGTGRLINGEIEENQQPIETNLGKDLAETAAADGATNDGETGEVTDGAESIPEATVDAEDDNETVTGKPVENEATVEKV